MQIQTCEDEGIITLEGAEWFPMMSADVGQKIDQWEPTIHDGIDDNLFERLLMQRGGEEGEKVGLEFVVQLQGRAIEGVQSWLSRDHARAIPIAHTEKAVGQCVEMEEMGGQILEAADFLRTFERPGPARPRARNHDIQSVANSLDRP